MNVGKRVEAEIARLRKERDAAQKEADWQMGQKLAAQVTLKAVTDALCLDYSALGNGWKEAAPKILARVEEIVDQASRDDQRAEAAEAALADTRRALDDTHLAAITMSEALEKIGESGPRPRQFRSDLEYVIHLQNIARRALAALDKP